jgi:TIR domain
MPIEIFISHSAKDVEANEARPADAEGAARYDLLAHQRAVRDAIVDALQQAGYTVLLDKLSLRGGDRWRATIHRWLGSCNGAVVLLDQESVKSNWLWKEAAILTWRASLGARMRVVPVFLGGFRSTELAESKLGSLQLGEEHAEREQPGETPQAFAARVVDAFGSAALTAEDTLVERWLEDVTETVALVGDVHLAWAAEKLGVDDDERANAPELARTVAHQLLHVPLESAIEGLRKLKASPKLSHETFARLVDLVVPGWVDAGAARNLRELLCRLPPRVILNASETETGREYVQRAHCCDVDTSDFIEFSFPAGEMPSGDLLEDFESLLMSRAGSRNRPALLRWAAKYGDRMYVLAGDELLSTELLEAIDRDYSSLRLILLGGPDPSATQALAPSAPLLEPTLAAGREDEIESDRIEARRLIPAGLRGR